MTKVRNQERFLGRIRSALGGARNRRQDAAAVFASRDEAHYRDLLAGINERTDAERLVLLKRLIEEGKPLNLAVFPKRNPAEVAAAIREIVARKSPEWGDEKKVAVWRHPLVDALDLPGELAGENVPVIPMEFTAGPKGDVEEERKALRKAVESAYIGVTSADFCIADTATLVLRTRPGQGRSVSLVPSIHIAVITLSQLLAELGELYAKLKWDEKERAEGLTNCMTLISGPSKTADIEATMVHGAHGPRELYLFVITG